MRQPNRNDRADLESRYQLYADYNKVMRNWLVAYGIGGPILFATNENLSVTLAHSPASTWITSLFLLGVGMQVLNAFINKWCAWHLYSGEYNGEYKERTLYKVWSHINDQHWIDFTFDMASLVMLSFATVWVVLIVSRGYQ